jgi:2-polyprenyl-3-methyl-5-hydroxy-6-metoxy-1,4-benzoquinol methylase
MLEAAEYAAIEACSGMVESARRAGVPAQCIFLEDFSASRRFDRVLAAGVLEFAEDPRQFMACLADQVAPAGRLVLLTPRPAFSGLAYAAWHRWKKCPSHIFSEKRFAQLFSCANFEIQEMADVSSISRCWSLVRKK